MKALGLLEAYLRPPGCQLWHKANPNPKMRLLVMILPMKILDRSLSAILNSFTADAGALDGTLFRQECSQLCPAPHSVSNVSYYNLL